MREMEKPVGQVQALAGESGRRKAPVNSVSNNNNRRSLFGFMQSKTNLKVSTQRGVLVTTVAVCQTSPGETQQKKTQQKKTQRGRTGGGFSIP